MNQFYYKFGDDEKFVDLGLGTQRVKCLVHNNFRLIVIADNKSVYNPKKYPIPLVNRLEKHLINMESVLNEKMIWMVKLLNEWVKEITKLSEKYAGFRMIGNGHIYTIGDCLKPATVGSCPTCKQKIGGVGYNLIHFNK